MDIFSLGGPTSKPVAIKSKKSARPQKQIAASCPAIMRLPPPPPPSRRPRVATVEPPPFVLPPSPPVFSESQVRNAQKEVKLVQRVLSHYSASCPDTSYMAEYLMQQGKKQLQEPTLQTPMEKRSMRSSSSHLSDDRKSFNDSTMLGKSPTIFSILQTSSPRSSVNLNRSSANSGFLVGLPKPALSPCDIQQSPEEDPDALFEEDNLQFAISLDQSDSYLGDSSLPDRMSNLFVFDE